MNQRAKLHAAPGTLRPAPGRAEQRRTGLKDRRALIPRREQGSRPRSRRRAAASVPPPLLLASHAPRRRHAPPPHTSITARLRRSPAPAQQSSADPGGPEARCCLRLPRRSQSGGRPFPGQRRPREPIAAAELAAGGGGGGGRGGENGGRELSLPLLAGEGGRQPMPRRRGRAPGAGSLTVPRGRRGPACSRRRQQPRGRREGWCSAAEPARVGS